MGSDALVPEELDALCEGWHPLFQKEDLVVLDGSAASQHCTASVCVPLDESCVD